MRAETINVEVKPNASMMYNKTPGLNEGAYEV